MLNMDTIAQPALFEIDGYTVGAEVDRFTFADGSMVGLHPVWHRGVPSVSLRCVRTDAHTWHLFDVTDVAPELKAELRLQPARDQRGYIVHTMRLRFPGARAFVAAVQAEAIRNGACDPDWRAAA